ncbi:Cilia- and flagella-associated protein 70 [Sparganum proliferum]
MGALLANRGLLEEAGALFEAATTYEENNSQVWIIFGLFCESIADDRRAEYGFCKARRIENSALASERPRLPEQQVEERRVSRKEGPRSAADAISQIVETAPKQLFPPSYRSSPFLQTAEVLLDAHLIKLTERAMAHHLIYMRKYLDHCLSYQPVPIPGTSLNEPPPVEEEGNCLKFLALPKQFPRSSPSNIAYVNELAQYHVLAAKVVMKKDLGDVSHRSISSHGKDDDYAEAIAQAQESLVTAMATDPENVEAWATLGELYSMADDRVSAIRCLERAMRLKSWPCRNSRLLQLRLAELYLKEEQFEKSKQIFLKCCQDAPSCLSWLGVGISCYRLSQLEDAEEALEEANALNNRNPTVWAYLSMICIEKRRVVEAEQSYKYAIKMGLNDKELLDELHGLQKKTGLGNPLQI